jgi:hypothetical protein
VQKGTIQIIETIIENDPTIDDSAKTQLLKDISRQPRRRKLIGIKAAAAILDCCELTIRRMVQRGQIEPIRFSPRRVRYSEDQILRIASEGVEEGE